MSAHSYPIFRRLALGGYCDRSLAYIPNLQRRKTAKHPILHSFPLCGRLIFFLKETRFFAFRCLISFAIEFAFRWWRPSWRVLLMHEHRQIPLIEFECADRHIRVQFSVTPVAMVKNNHWQVWQWSSNYWPCRRKKVRLFMRNRPTRILWQMRITWISTIDRFLWYYFCLSH